MVVKPLGKRRFAQPQSEMDIQAVKKSHILKKTLQNTEWAQGIWREWATYRLEQPLSAEKCRFGLDSDITKISTPAVNHWLQRFVIEVRKVSGEHYCPDSLHQICCGLQRALRTADRVDVNFFESSEFAPFRDVLDGELKWLNATGKYVHKKKAEIITEEMEEILWQKGLLGDHSPHVLLDTMVCFNRVLLRSKEW